MSYNVYSLLAESGAADHEHSSACWGHGDRRRGAGLRPGPESRPENHRGEFILPSDTGGPAAGAFIVVIVCFSSQLLPTVITCPAITPHVCF